MKRILSLCLAFALCMSLLAGVTVPASAATSGTCGKDLTWTLDDNGTLTISGTGEMKSFIGVTDVPWYDNRSSIKTVVIEEGVTSIGVTAFNKCSALTSVTISNSVTKIESFAFSDCWALTSITIPDGVTSIWYKAFYGCTKLNKITIPDSVTSIQGYAFYGSSLTDVYYGGAETDKDNIAIGDYNECLLNATWHYNYVQSIDVTLSTVDGAQIRTTGAQGLRFISSIDKTSLDFDRVVEYGTILIPSADITDISELVIGATLNGHAVAKVEANYLYAEDDESLTFTAVITNIAEKNYAREYTARAYAIMDDGSVVYADEGASRSIYAVAKRGLENPNESDANKKIFQAIVDIVENA